MKRFVFPLRAVLEVREREERERKLVVAGLERERVELEGVLRGHQSTLRVSKERVREALGGGGGGDGVVDFAGLRFETGSSLGVTMKANQVVLRLAGVHKRLEGARGSLVEASRSRRAVELLKEKRLAEWRRERDRRERVELDEIGSLRRTRGDQVHVAGGGV